MSISSTYDSAVNAFYLAFYGRPADPAGLKFWSAQLASSNSDLGAITQAFANSQEAQDRFGNDSVGERIADIYQQLFNRAPEKDGLDYWTKVVENGHASIADVAIAILDAAVGTDADLSALRQQAIDAFTARVEASGSQYSGYAAIEAARILARSVTPGATAKELDQLVKAAVSFADTASKTPQVVEAIAVNSSLLALFDTSRGRKEPVDLAQALADVAKAAAGDPVTLESLLRGGGMAQVLKAMPSRATLKEVVEALAEGGLPAAVAVVYPSTPPTPPAPVQSIEFHFAELRQDPHDKDVDDGITNVRYTNITFDYVGKNLRETPTFSYRIDGGEWIDADLLVDEDNGTVTIVGLDLLAAYQDGPPPSEATVSIEVQGAVGGKTIGTIEYTVDYDGAGPTAGLSFDSIQDGAPGDDTTTRDTADVNFRIDGELGDAFIEYRLDGRGPWIVLDPEYIHDDGTFTIPGIDLADSDPTLNVRLVDAAGNVGVEISQPIDGPFEVVSGATGFQFIVTGSPSMMYLRTSPEQIVSVPGTDNAGMLDRSGLQFLDMRDGSEQPMATDYLDGVNFHVFDGGGVRFDDTILLGLYKLAWEDGAFATSTGTVGAGELIFAGGVRHGAVYQEGFALDRIDTLASDIDVSGGDNASVAYVHNGSEARSIVTGGGQDVIVNNGGDLQIGWRSFSAAGQDLVIGFNSGHDTIALLGDAAEAIDRDDSGDLEWVVAPQGVKAVVTATTEAVSIRYTGAVATDGSAFDENPTIDVLVSGIDVKNMAADSDLLILATKGTSGALLHFRDLDGNGEIDEGEAFIVALFDDGVPVATDVTIVGSSTPPDGQPG